MSIPAFPLASKPLALPDALDFFRRRRCRKKHALSIKKALLLSLALTILRSDTPTKRGHVLNVSSIFRHAKYPIEPYAPKKFSVLSSPGFHPGDPTNFPRGL